MKTGIGKLKVKLKDGGFIGPGDPPSWQTVIGPSGRAIKFDSNKVIPIKGRANRFTIFDEDSLMYYDVDREPVKGSYTVDPMSARFEKELKNTGPVSLGDSNKSYSKERFREKYASGGNMPYTPVGLPVSPQSIAAQKETFKTSFGEQLSNFASNPVVQSIAGLVPGLGTGLSIAGKLGGTQTLPTTPTTAEAFEKVEQKKYDDYAATGGKLKDGGPVNPNIQVLGDITFNTDKARKDPRGFLVVKDQLTGKDYGVVRNKDGRYDWYRDPIINEKDPIKSVDKYYDYYMNSPQKRKRASERGYSAADLDMQKRDLKRTYTNTNYDQPLSDSHFTYQNTPDTLLQFPEINIGLNKDLPDTGLASAYAHEKSHASHQRSYSTGDKVHELANIKNINKLQSVNHDSKTGETKADVDAVRYLLYNNGLYDAGQETFTKEHYQKVLNDPNLKKDFIINRLLQNANGEEGFINLMNKLSLQDNSPKTSVRNAATGGALNHMGGTKTKGDSDVRLSNNAIQVKGNPHMTDGNSYSTPGSKVHLDDGEVVRGNMVISNKLTNPLTGKTFAEDATKKEKLIEKLTKRNSLEDRTTITRLNKDVDELINLQETMATKMGLRKTQPDEIMMASGGPVPKDLNVKEFQEWLIKNGVTIKADGKWGAETETAYNQFKDPYLLRNRTNTLEDLQDIAYRMDQKPGDVATLNDNAERAAQINLRTPLANLKPLGTSIQFNNNLPYAKDPLTGQYPNEAFTTTPPDISSSRIPTPKSERDVLMTKLGIIPNMEDGTSSTNNSTTEYTPTESPDAESVRMNNLTPGTALQGIAAASQLVRSFGKGPANKSYQMTTPVSENYYSADQALQQNQSNYAQARNSIDAGSVNVRRAMTNSLYATKLNSDNQVISNTNDMNRAAKIDYENRLSQRQGQNIQLAQYKNELDARDLGAQNNAKDVAFNTMSNFGRAMDQQKSAFETLQLLKTMYPDVYGNVEKKKKK